jgi:SAM-dependent methyltransferase
VLNRAARYFPIVRELEKQLGETDSILEVGSGPYGLGQFYHRHFMGCDVGFAIQPRKPMTPVVATATQLPFADGSFDFVIVSDVLEHVPPDQRRTVIREALRVTRKVAVFGFPCGQQAFECDRKLADLYDRQKRDSPVWLKEHLQHPFPTEQLFEDLSREWKVWGFGNENLDFHLSMMRREMHRLWSYFFLLSLAVLPRLVEYLLRRADSEPFYRRIFWVQYLDTSTGK